MESIIKTNVLEHLTSSNLLTPHQFGFLRGHSCTTHIQHHTEAAKMFASRETQVHKELGVVLVTMV